MSNFVTEFLKIGNFSSRQKDKMIELIVKDLTKQKVGETTENVPVSVIDPDEKSDKSKDKDYLGETFKDYNNPFGEKSLSKFLLAYNQDSLLKYTWHSIDSETIDHEDETLTVKQYIMKLSGSSEYSVREHQRLLLEKFEILNNKYYADSQVKTLLKVYLSGTNFKEEKKEWSSNRIDINWASEQLLKWSDENPDCVPNASGELKQQQNGKVFKLPKPFNSYMNGKRVRNFSELIIHCKNLFHIRTDNSLKSILEYNIANNENWKTNFDFEFKNFAENIVLFTDVDKLVQFFREYINSIETYFSEEYKTEQKQKIILSFIEETGGFVYFTIHHIHPEKPFYGKSSESTIDRRGNTLTSMIKKINGMCELYLESDFENEASYRINLWNGEWNDGAKKYTPKLMKKEKIEKVNGVKHILKFKR